MKKAEVIEQIKQSRALIDDAIAGLTPDQMLRPGVIGLWSVKDMLAHLAAWQSELITALSRLDTPKVTPEIVKIEDIYAWNDDTYHANAPRPLDIVLEDFQGVHKHLLKMVQDMPEKDLNDVRKFEWMEGEPLWYLLAENGFWHEQEHAAQIAAWREAQGL